MEIVRKDPTATAKECHRLPAQFYNRSCVDDSDNRAAKCDRSNIEANAIWDECLIGEGGGMDGLPDTSIFKGFPKILQLF